MPIIGADAFPDFYNSTRATILTGVQFVANFAQRTNYPFSALMAGQNPFDAVQHGTSIIETVQTRSQGGFGSYNPGDRANISVVPVTKQLAFAWRLYRNPTTWTDFEYTQKTGGGSSREAIKNFAKVKEQARVTEHVNGLDFLMFAVPNSDTMESTLTGDGTGAVASLPVYISEDSTRFRPPASVWSPTTVAGLDCTATGETAWRNKILGYTSATPFHGTTGILPAWDRTLLALQYNAMAKAGDAFMTTGPSDLITFTNGNGFVLLKQASREYNDRWENPGDGGVPNPRLNGVQVVHAPQLDVALLDQGAGATYTGLAYPKGFPRYFVVNKRTIHPVFLGGDYMKRLPAARDHVNYPDVTVVHTTSSLNIACNDRSKNAIIAPDRDDA